MIVTQVSTTLKGQDGENYILGPYLFETHAEKSAWRDELDAVLADFYCTVRQNYFRLEPLLVYYDEDVPVVLAVVAPTPEFLVNSIRELWYSGELNLDSPVLAVA